MIAGRFEWDYPLTTTTSNGIDTTVKIDIWEDRRLAIQFDVSNQFYFGVVDDLEDDETGNLIQWASSEMTALHYRREGFTAGLTQAHRLTTRKFLYDTAFPADIAAYDILRNSSLSGSSQFVTSGEVYSRNIEPELPDSATDTALMLLGETETRRGAALTDIRFGIGDRNENQQGGTDQEYRWQQDFVRTADGVYESKKFMPRDNYELDFTELLRDDYFGRPDREFKIELFEEPSGESESGDHDESPPFFEAHLVVDIAETYPVTLPATYVWKMQSTGTAGTIVHVEKNRDTNAREDGVDTFLGDLGDNFKLRTRGSVIEFMGGWRDEDGIRSRYQYVPFWHNLEEPPKVKLRLTFTGDDPEPGTLKRTGIHHPADKKNTTCPPNQTCELIDDYSHQEWRVKSITITNFTFMPFVTATHTGCGAYLATEDLPVIQPSKWRKAKWDRSATGYYDLADNLYHKFQEVSAVELTSPYRTSQGTVEDVINYLDLPYLAAFFTESRAVNYPLTFNSRDIAIIGPRGLGLDAQIIISSQQHTYSFTEHLHDNVSYPPADAELTGANVTVNVAPEHEFEEGIALPDAFQTDGDKFMLTSRVGKGLLFEFVVDEWVVLVQLKSFDLETQLTSTEITELNDLLTGGFIYHYSVGAEFYTLTNPETAPAVTEDAFVIPSTRFRVKSELTIEYLSVTHADMDTYFSDLCVVQNITGQGGPIGPVRDEFDEVTEPVPGSDEIPASVNWDNLFTYGSGGGEDTYIGEPTVTEMEWELQLSKEYVFEPQFNEYSLQLVPTGTTYETNFFKTGTQVSSEVVPDTTIGSPTYTHYEYSYTDAWDKTLPRTSYDTTWEDLDDPEAPTSEGVHYVTTLSSVVSRTIILEKVVDQWHDRGLPTIVYSIDDALEGEDTSDILRFVSQTDTLHTSTAEDGATSVQKCVTWEEVSIDDLALTIGPSTYAP